MEHREVYTVELYARVRRAVLVEGMSHREAARQFGLARETVRKMLRYPVPPGYQRQQPARRPKLDAWVKTEHDYTGGYTIIKKPGAPNRLRASRASSCRAISI